MTTPPAPLKETDVPKPPKYGCDDEVVYEYVLNNVADEVWEVTDEDLQYRDHPPLRVVVTLASLERLAIEAARRGDFKRFAGLMKNPEYLPGPEAREIMSSKQEGTFKGTGGRPKQPRSRRENAQYFAAKEVDHFTKVLRRIYPEEKGHRERAITFAAWWAKISRQSLDTYLRSRHRLR